MGRERGCSGTHILKDFELQRCGIQVIEFPCKGRAHIREGSALPRAAPCSTPVSPQAPPHPPDDPHSFQVISGWCLLVQLTSQALLTP